MGLAHFFMRTRNFVHEYKKAKWDDAVQFQVTAYEIASTICWYINNNLLPQMCLVFQIQ